MVSSGPLAAGGTGTDPHIPRLHHKIPLKSQALTLTGVVENTQAWVCARSADRI